MRVNENHDAVSFGHDAAAERRAEPFESSDSFS